MTDVAVLPKLGCTSPNLDASRLRLASYLPAALPTPPPSVDLSTAVHDWDILGNGTYGDCTCAAAAHAIQVWTAAVDAELVPQAADVIRTYFAIGGPGTTADSGLAESNVLSWWRNTGILGHKADAYVAVGDYMNFDQDLIDLAIWLFGGVQVTLWLPVALQNQIASPRWDIPDDIYSQFNPDGTSPNWYLPGDWRQGSWGGHEIVCVGYDKASGDRIVVSWGRVYRVGRDFWLAYVSGVDAVLSHDFLHADGTAIDSGLRLDALTADLAHLNDPPAPPPPQPPPPAPSPTGVSHQMFTPPIALDGLIVGVLSDPADPSGHAFWMCTQDGAVYSFLGAQYHGSPHEHAQPGHYFAGHTAKDIEAANPVEKAAGKVYAVVDTTGARYAYPDPTP